MSKSLAFLLIVTALLNVRCAMTESMNASCQGSDIEMGCKTLFGSKDAEQDNRLNELTKRVNQLTQQMNTNLQLISVLVQFEQQNSIELDQLQFQTNILQTQLTALLTAENVIGLIDPCGNGPGYDEVLLRLSSGRTIAYFKHASNEFLTVLEPGYYRTTDTQACNFTVNAQGLVCDNGGCR